MMARTSARSSVNRDTAASPAKAIGGRQSSRSHSPAMRTTRSTRSQSRDLGEAYGAPSLKSSTKHRNRDVSVERKNPRVASRAADLSMVAEDQEYIAEEGMTKAQRQPQSPGNTSGLSGTTALMSQSMQELEDMDAGMPTAEKLQPAADIIPAFSRKSFLTKGTIKFLQKRKGPIAPPSNQQQAGQLESRQPETPSSQAVHSREPATAPAKISNDREAATVRGPDDEVGFEQPPPRSTAEVLDIFERREEEKNKENRIPKRKRTIYDRQEDAERIQWDSQEEFVDPFDDNVITSSTKRPIEAISVDEDEVVASEDEGFQQAQEPVDPRKRAQAPVARAREPVPASQPQIKRPRFSDVVEKRKLVQRQEQALQASARAADYEDDAVPPPSYKEVNETSKAITARRMGKTQIRTPWSFHDTERLIELIGRHGCSWSAIQKRHGFDREVDQVGIKDKARNIKVDYLKSGTALPLNFDGIALGAKEKAKVLSAGMNPYRLEGEELGQESIGMDGQPID